MGVEPTRDRAERPLNRFEDGEAHRDPYTSIRRSMPCLLSVVKPHKTRFIHLYYASHISRLCIISIKESHYKEGNPEG